MNVIKFPCRVKSSELEDLAKRFNAGEFVSVMVVAVRSNNTFLQIDVTSRPVDLKTGET